MKVEVVDRGKEKGQADAVLVEEAIKQRWVLSVKVNLPVGFAKICEQAGLQKGEAAVLKHAQEKKITALLDDQQARTLARSLGVPIKGSLGILVEATRMQLITRPEAMEKLDQLSDIMYLTGDLYRLVRRALEQI